VTIVRACALAAAVSAAAAAQSNPDLAGTWTLDAGKSDQVQPAARGTAATPDTMQPAKQLTISVAADNASITLGAQPVVFKFDGTETFWFQGGEYRGTAAWEGGRLVVSWKREFYAGPRQGYMNYSGRDVYTVANGALTVEKTTTGPAGTATKKFVYTKS
jgi:hypothetical protein